MVKDEYDNMDIGIFALQAWAVLVIAGILCAPFGSPPSFLEALLATGVFKLAWWFANREAK